MDGLSERDRREFTLVEAAMRTYPLADTPPDFAGAVMSRVRAAAPAQRFRVSWLEVLVSLFVPGSGLLALVAWASLPAQTAAYLQDRLAVLWQFLQRTGLDWALLACGLSAVVFFFAMTLRFFRPRYRRPKVVPVIPLRLF